MTASGNAMSGQRTQLIKLRWLFFLKNNNYNVEAGNRREQHWLAVREKEAVEIGTRAVELPEMVLVSLMVL